MIYTILKLKGDLWMAMLTKERNKIGMNAHIYAQCLHL